MPVDSNSRRPLEGTEG